MMFPIYGCGALLGPIGKWIDDWLNPGKSLSVKKSDLAVRHGMLYMVLIFVAEYATGRSTNIDGLIRLDFAPLWFATGLLFEQITKKKGG